MVFQMSAQIISWLVFTFGCVCYVHGYDDYEPVTITRGPEDQKVKAYGLVSFECEVSGNPPPIEIFWRRYGYALSPDSYQTYVVDRPNGSVLRMEPVLGESSVVDCVAVTESGDEVIASANLIVYQSYEVPEGFPEIVQHPRHALAQELGKSVLLNCEAEGDPELTYRWYKELVPLNMDSTDQYEILEYGVLFIKSLKSSDAGTYDCSAENALGTTFSYTSRLYVRVHHVAPHFIVAPPESLDVTRGDELTMDCAAAGNPVPLVKWLRYDEDLGEPASGHNVLEVISIQESTDYTCVATSAVGETRATVRVNVMTQESFDEWY